MISRFKEASVMTASQSLHFRGHIVGNGTRAIVVPIIASHNCNLSTRKLSKLAFSHNCNLSTRKLMKLENKKTDKKINLLTLTQFEHNFFEASSQF